MSHNSRRLIALCLVAILLSGCQRIFGRTAEGESATPSPIPTPIVPDEPTYIVQRGRITKQLEFVGRVSPVEEITLHFKADGYVKQVLVERNDRVEAGDLLAELEIDDLQKQTAQAEVALNSAQLRLAEAEDALERQIAQAKLDLTAAQTRLTLARDENAAAITQAGLALAIAQEQLARLQAQQPDYEAAVLTADIGRRQAQDALAREEIEYQKALDRAWEPQEVRDGYARALQQAQWSHQLAQARYEQALVAQQVYLHDVKIQELLVAKSEAALQQLQVEENPLLALEVQQANQQLDWLEEGVDPLLVNEVNQAQLALERLQAQVSEAQIVAPMDGEVLSVSIFAGRPAEAFTPAIILADPGALEVRANLTTRQLQEMVEGQDATILLSAYPSETWYGMVRRLPYPYGTGGGTQALAGADDSVSISLEGDLSALELGDLARVTIILEQKDDALWLPPAAIRTFQGRKFVIVKEVERQRRVDITVGIEGVDRVEILEGLEEGQVVIGP